VRVVSRQITQEHSGANAVIDGFLGKPSGSPVLNEVPWSGPVTNQGCRVSAESVRPAGSVLLNGPQMKGNKNAD